MENLDVFDCSNILVASYFDSGNPEKWDSKAQKENPSGFHASWRCTKKP